MPVNLAMITLLNTDNNTVSNVCAHRYCLAMYLYDKYINIIGNSIIPKYSLDNKNSAIIHFISYIIFFVPRIVS